MLGKAGATRARGAVLVLILPLLLPSVSSATPEAAGPGALLVTLREGARGEDVAARAGSPFASPLAGLSLLLVPDAPGVAGALARDPDVRAVEPDGVARIAAATWNSGTWNSGTWNSGTWNSGTWNGATWNGATWNGVQWNGATWNGLADETGLAPPWGLLAVRAPEAWALATSAREVVVCMVDTGVDASHPALRDALLRDAEGRAGVNLLDPGAAPDDPTGHGTHLAGIVAAARDALAPGLAPTARITVAKAFDDAGRASTSDIIRGLAHCDAADADVVLLAFTEDAPTRAFREALAALQRRGALVVASVGNEGCDRCVAAPATLPGVLGVAAFTPEGAPAAFNSDGAHVDLLAPGVLVTSAYPGGAYRTGSGTSQAAAFAAGAAALVLAERPTLDARALAAHLERTADAQKRLDAAAALAELRGVGR